MSKELPDTDDGLIQKKTLEISDNIAAGNDAYDDAEIVDYSELSDEEEEKISKGSDEDEDAHLMPLPFWGTSTATGETSDRRSA